jgi:hypothetical protein
MKHYMQESDIVIELEAMVEDKAFRTVPGYSVDAETYPDNKVPFIEEHLYYLRRHPQVDPMHYLSNLRLMLKIR